MNAITIAYVFTASVAALYASFELRFLWAFLRQRRAIRALRAGAQIPGAAIADRDAPTVTIQIPLYNERSAAQTAIRAAALQNYPHDRFDIQVLDDSTDDTIEIVAALVAELAAQGVRITHVRRGDRKGYKAGALAFGLQHTNAELIAMFDADFAPAEDFLRRLILDLSSFEDATVAFVQARWAFINSEENLLTSAQRLLIDRHFYVQKPTWAHLGRVTQFNGSAGVWRRAAIDDAGGWSSDTLSEDLDLSYRVALRGWHGLYFANVKSDSELPAHLLSFKLQQRRWARGSAQAIRKLVPGVTRNRALRSRADELFILGGYMVHPILLLNALLWPWAVLYAEPRGLFLVGQAILSIATTVGPISFVVTARESGRPLSVRFVADVLFATVLGMGLMVNNTIAHISGFFMHDSRFERTPKRPRSQQLESYRLPIDWTLAGELALLVYSIGSAVLLARAGEILWVPPCILWALAMTMMVTLQLAPQERHA